MKWVTNLLSVYGENDLIDPKSYRACCDGSELLTLQDAGGKHVSRYAPIPSHSSHCLRHTSRSTSDTNTTVISGSPPSSILDRHQLGKLTHSWCPESAAAARWRRLGYRGSNEHHPRRTGLLSCVVGQRTDLFWFGSNAPAHHVAALIVLRRTGTRSGPFTQRSEPAAACSASTKASFCGRRCRREGCGGAEAWRTWPRLSRQR